MWIALLIILIFCLIVLTLSYICYRIVFTVDKRKLSDPHRMLPGEQYAERKNEILPLVDSALAIPYTDVWLTSHDGRRLHAAYYEFQAGAPTEIMCHGYQSIALRDFCGGLQMALNVGHNVLLIDQRAHGQSEGRCLTFGILERQDCLAWANYLCRKNGAEVPIILVGVSMGAATVLMASSLDLPHNVVGILADSGYTSPKEIICKVITDRRLPPSLVYPFVRLGATLFGGFRLEECNAPDALRNCKIPVLFIHGEDDRFVPCEMTHLNYAACASEKTLLTIPNAGHGLGCLVDKRRYNAAVKKFFRHITANYPPQ